MKTSLLLLAAAATLAACGHMNMGLGAGPHATAMLAPTTGSTTAGTVRFAQSGERVRVSGEIRGLKPGAEHAFHVHEKGDCSSGDGMSAGGHFNPAAAPHGRHGAGTHHA